MLPTKRITFSNLEIEYIIVGKGLPVLFIHGFGETYHVWSNQIEVLKNNYQVIACNLPGTSSSEKHLNTSITLQDMSKCIKQLMTSEHIEKFVLLGHSMGGYVSLAYQHLYPNDLIGLGMIHSTSFADTEQKINARKKSISFIKTQGAEPFLKQSFPELFHDKIKNRTTIESLLYHSKTIPLSTLCGYYEAIMQRPNRINSLKNINIPVLFIAGQHDTLIPLEESLIQCHLPSRSFLKILEHSSHLGMLEQPDEFNEILTTFLDYIHQFNK